MTHVCLNLVLFLFTQPEFCSLTHLVKVDLSKNQLTCLPDDLGNLVNLQHLDLYNNKLTILPVSFSQLRVRAIHKYRSSSNSSYKIINVVYDTIYLTLLCVCVCFYTESEVVGSEG